MHTNGQTQELWFGPYVSGKCYFLIIMLCIKGWNCKWNRWLEYIWYLGQVYFQLTHLADDVRPVRPRMWADYAGTKAQDRRAPPFHHGIHLKRNKQTIKNLIKRVKFFSTCQEYPNDIEILHPIWGCKASWPQHFCDQHDKRSDTNDKPAQCDPWDHRNLRFCKEESSINNVVDPLVE